MTRRPIEEALESSEFRRILQAESARRHQLEPSRLWRIAVITPDGDDVRTPLTPAKAVAVGLQPRLPQDEGSETAAFLGAFGLAGPSDIGEELGSRLQDKWDRRVLRTVMDGWPFEYRTRGRLDPAGLISLPDGLEVETPGPFVPLPEFLRGEGFSVMKTSTGGPDLFTSEVSGLAAIGASDAPTKPWRLPYFIQRSLVDDEGGLICLGLDEGLKDPPLLPFGPIETNACEFPFPVHFLPCAAHIIARELRNHEIQMASKGKTLIRYVFYPTFDLPLLDTPLQCAPWTDVFIRADGVVFAYLPKPDSSWLGTELKELWDRELEKKHYHLLSFIRDANHVADYLTSKTQLLRRAFEIVQLPSLTWADTDQV